MQRNSEICAFQRNSYYNWPKRTEWNNSRANCELG